jgi:hypothetical protein
MAERKEGAFPNLNELFIEVRGLRELVESRLTAEQALSEVRALANLMGEREKRHEKQAEFYDKRDGDRQEEVRNALAAVKDQTAQNAAAAKEAVTTAFQAAKEAQAEFKKGQDAYNVQHNDLIRKGEADRADTLERVREMITSATGGIGTQVAEVKRDLEKLKDIVTTGTGKWAGANNLWLVLLAVGMAALAVMTFLKTPH